MRKHAPEDFLGTLERHREGRVYVYRPPVDEQTFLRDQAEADEGEE